MNEIQIFNNPEFGAIRTAGDSANPLFCAVDVAKALGYANPAKAIIDHCKGVTVLGTPTKGGTQQVKFISESEVYRLIFKSNATNAEKFNSWVAEEVLPTIRKHGAYATAETIEELITNPENGIKLLTALRDERQHRLQAEATASRLEAQAKENQPKVVYADAVAGSRSACLIGELAKMISQNGVPMGEKRLFQWMRDNHYLCDHGERRNQPYQRYIEQGLFTLKQNVFSVDGEMRTRTTTKVTGKGQVYFVNKFIEG